MHGSEPIVTLTDVPTAEEEHAVGSGLARFNEQQGGPGGGRKLAVIVRDPETRKPIGGLTGRTSRGLLFVDLFFLPDHLRGGGLGSRLYERHGYRVLGTVPCLPPGTSRVFLTKSLA